MKTKSRAAIALACILALAPLAACGQTPQNDHDPEGDNIVMPPQDTPPTDTPVLPPVTDEPDLPD